MMAAIWVDGCVIKEHDFNGMTLEYFLNFVRYEFIPAYRDELSEEDIKRLYDQLEKKKTRIAIGKHFLAYKFPCLGFGNDGITHDFDGF